jgi:two-component system, LytTR family, sensor kinase
MLTGYMARRRTDHMKRAALRAGRHCALWTVVVVLFALQNYTYDALYGHPLPVFQYFRWSMEGWYTWAAISPLVFWLAAKYPLDAKHPRRFISRHLVASVAVAFLAVAVLAFISHYVEPGIQPLRKRLMLALGKGMAMNILTYWSLLGLAQALHFYRENNERRLRETQLQTQLAQTQLQVLQMQLHPHFLFNTLHAIGTLIHEDPVAAEQILLNLGALLRVFLEQESLRQISLKRELHLVDLYLSIQRIRFRDRLTVRSIIAPDTLDGSVPSLILQPIVENAIVHGIAKNPGSDVIEIRSSKQQDSLVIEISNSNSLLRDDVRQDGVGWGIGLSNTEQRLEQIYNGAATLSIQTLAPRGVVCRIAVPFMRSTSIPSAEEELLAL